MADGVPEALTAAIRVSPDLDSAMAPEPLLRNAVQLLSTAETELGHEVVDLRFVAKVSNDSSVMGRIELVLEQSRVPLVRQRDMIPDVRLFNVPVLVAEGKDFRDSLGCFHVATLRQTFQLFEGSRKFW